MSIDSLVFDNTSVINSKLIDLSVQDQKVIANNIANASTPNFTRMHMDFKRRLADAVSAGDMEQVINLKPIAEEDTTHAPGADGNNVILPDELNAMMENSVFYNLVTKAFKTRMNILKAAIK